MRDLSARKNVALHGPALLACERLLPRDPSRCHHSGLWRRLGNLDDLLVAVHDVCRGAVRSTGVEDPTHFDARCTRFLGVNYDELVEQTLRGGSNEEVLEWCFARGRQPTTRKSQSGMRFLESAAGEMERARNSPSRRRKQILAIARTFKRGLICMTPKKEEHPERFARVEFKYSTEPNRSSTLVLN